MTNQEFFDKLSDTTEILINVSGALALMSNVDYHEEEPQFYAGSALRSMLYLTEKVVVTLQTLETEYSQNFDVQRAYEKGK